jgi:hypothetical protein
VTTSFFAFLYFAPFVILFAGSILLFHREKTVSAVLMLVGSILLLFVAAMPMISNTPRGADFLNAIHSHLRAPLPGIIAQGCFALGFFLHVMKRAKSHSRSSEST